MKVRKEAKWAHRVHEKRGGVGPWYRLSVWADAARVGETKDELKLRLVRAAGLGGISLADVRNSAFYTTKAQELLTRGFAFKKDGYPGEPWEHYSIDLGPEEPSRERVEEFVGCFEGPERREGNDDDAD